MYHQESHSQRGFTLVELSIVLVIIGLLVGAVLVGRDLIRTATIRATIKQVESYNTAVNAFRVKFGCLPGDCAAAEDFGFAINTSGTGDGVIGYWSSAPCPDPVNDPDCQTSEFANFWYHLSASGMLDFAAQDYYSVCVGGCVIGGEPRVVANTVGYMTPPVKLPAVSLPYSNPPVHSAGGWNVQGEVTFNPDGVFPIEDQFVPHSFVMGVPYTISASPRLAGYSPADLYAIDVKIDDGLPLGGQARAVSRAGSAPPNNFNLTNNLRGWPGKPGYVPAEAFCAEDTGSAVEYNKGYAGNAGAAAYPSLAWRVAGNCTLIIKAAF